MLSNRGSFVQSRLLKSSNERRLALGLLAVVGFAMTPRLLGSGIGLWSEQHRTIAQMESRIESLNQELEHHETLTTNLRARQSTSLPADSVLAGTRYYAWLYALAGRHGLSEIKIDRTAPVPEASLGERLQFALHAKASMDGIGQFLDEFQSYSLLHGITYMQMLDYSPLTNEVRVELTIEALCLSDAAIYDLPEFSSLDTDGPLTELVATRNPFRRYEPPKPVTAATVAAVPVVDPLSKVRFVGVVQRDGVKQAWFYDSLNNNEMLLNIGSRLTVGEFNCQITQLDEENAWLNHNDQQLQIRLGQTLRVAVGATH